MSGRSAGESVRDKPWKRFTVLCGVWLMVLAFAEVDVEAVKRQAERDGTLAILEGLIK